MKKRNVTLFFFLFFFLKYTLKEHITCNLSIVGLKPPSKAPVVSLSKKLYPHCLVLVGSRNGFKREWSSKRHLTHFVTLEKSI